MVAACGAIHTPALLRRSGLQNPNIGKNLRLHPATAVWGIFDEELKPWEGVMQALYSDQFRDLDDGYGLKYETAAQHPHLFVPFAPWRGAREHFGLMEAISSTVPIGVLLRDRDGGEVRVGRDGEPVVRYKLSEFEADHLRTGIDGAAQMLEAAGARRVFSSHAKWVGYSRPRRPAARAQFMADADSLSRLQSPRPGRPELVPHHGLGADGRFPGDLGVRPDRPDVGGPRAVRARRFELSERLGRQPADLDPGDRAHGRAGAGRTPELKLPALRAGCTGCRVAGEIFVPALPASIRRR